MQAVDDIDATASVFNPTPVLRTGTDKYAHEPRQRPGAMLVCANAALEIVGLRIADDHEGNTMYWRRLPSLYRILILVLPLLMATDTHAGSGRTLLAFDVFELNLDVNTTLDIQGETHFFSSRHNSYVGGRLVGHSKPAENKTVSFGHFMGVMWGKSSFLLNWEEPGLQSFPPLDSSISTIAIPFGWDLNLRVGEILTISPYVSGKPMWHIMSVEIGNEDFKGSAVKLGVDAGIKVSVKAGKRRLAAGIGWTHIINDEIEFEIEDLTFDSTTSGSSLEYFLGVEF